MDVGSPFKGRAQGEVLKRERMDDRTAHAEYERRKADWVRANPEATPQEYQAAMTRIARECGI